MSKFLTWFRQEMEVIKPGDIKPPGLKVQEGEILIGTIKSIGVRRLFHLFQRLTGQTLELKRQQIHQMADKLQTTVGKASRYTPKTAQEDLVLHRQMLDLWYKFEAVKGFYWAALLAEISEEGCRKIEKHPGCSFGIRKNWEIVACSSETPDEVMEQILAIEIPIA
ncbi:MAG: hypothetical protein AAB455_01205 [Patescibacteria group bacterium]